MKRPLLLLLLALLLTMPGCVRRRLLVRSNPPGATVHVDNQPIGNTPCGVDFTYYGTREVRLAMPGYETLTVNLPIPTPWYQVPGIDFVSENLLPNQIEDIRTVSYDLARARMAPAEEVISRGEQLRAQATPVGLAPIGAVADPSLPLGASPSMPPLVREPAPTLAPLQPEGIPSVPATSPPNGFRY